MTSQFSNMTSSSFFWRFVSLVKFSSWCKFRVNIITGSWDMSIFFDKGLTRNPEIGNTPIWVLPNICRLGGVRYTKFGTNVSNKMLLNVAKFQGYSFYCFWVIKNSFFIEHLRTRASEKNSKLEILRDSLFINLLK